MPVKDTSMPAPSATEPFVDRYRRVTPKWYPWVRRMIDSLRQTVLTVNTIETQVGTIETTVDLINADLNSVELTVASLQDTTVEQGLQISETLTLVSGLQGDLGAIQARWAVQINGNNQVVGLVRLDGGATGSQFTVVADKFVIAHPTSAETTMTAFVVGQVNGVPTVGINGDVLIDGSVRPRHISVTSLDALNANLGTVTAGIIQGNKVYINLNTGEWYVDA